MRIQFCRSRASRLTIIICSLFSSVAFWYWNPLLVEKSFTHIDLRNYLVMDTIGSNVSHDDIKASTVTSSKKMRPPLGVKPSQAEKSSKRVRLSGAVKLSRRVSPFGAVKPSKRVRPSKTVKPSEADFPTIYVITPTYPRMEQIAEITRLGQTLMNVPKLFWIVAEDSSNLTLEVTNFLEYIGIDHVHILGAMPEAYREETPKGVSNRIAGLNWIRQNAPDHNGVMYFADDDNAYDLRLFEEMRFTKRVSMWPVGLIASYCVSSPVVRNGKVVDFYDGWKVDRVFPVDMAGFAVNVGFLISRGNSVTMPFVQGYEEDGFLKSLNITLADIEPKANNCTQIYVWHTKTEKNKFPEIMAMNETEKYYGSNVIHLAKLIGALN